MSNPHIVHQAFIHFVLPACHNYSCTFSSHQTIPRLHVPYFLTILTHTSHITYPAKSLFYAVSFLAFPNLARQPIALLHFSLTPCPAIQAFYIFVLAPVCTLLLTIKYLWRGVKYQEIFDKNIHNSSLWWLCHGVTTPTQRTTSYREVCLHYRPFK